MPYPFCPPCPASCPNQTAQKKGLRSSIKMSAAKRLGRWQGGGAADSAQVRQGVHYAASGILLELLNKIANFYDEYKSETYSKREVK
jgi:hypothetical protein